MKKEKQNLFNIPNQISLFRFLCAPIVILLYLLSIPYGIGEFVAAGVFLIGSISDIVDGYIARKYNLITDFGKFIDSIADKFLQTTGLILVSEVLPIRWLAILIVLIVVLRDILINGVRQVVCVKGKVLAADFYGKIKTVFMDVAIVILMVYGGLISCLPNGDASKILGLPIDIILTVGFALLIVSTILCVFSGINYVVNSWSIITGKEEVENIEESAETKKVESDKDVDNKSNKKTK